MFEGETRRDHPLRRSLGRPLAALGAMALLCSTVAWASLPEASGILRDGERQWQALGLEPLSDGGGTGIRMAPQSSVAAVDFVPSGL